MSGGALLVVAALWLTAAPAFAASSCDPALVGFTRVACELEAARATPLCDPIDPKLQAATAANLERALVLLRAAEAAPRPRRARRLLRACGKRLTAIEKRARRAGRRAKITPDCLLAIETWVAELRGVLATLAPDIPQALPGLPGDVAGFEAWLRLNAEPIPPRSSDPHSGTKNVYVNQTRDTLAPQGTQRFPYPEGSIVVKAVVRPGRDFIGLFAIMRKRAGSDPEHNDWTFIEYARQAASEPFSEVARDGVCWVCHGSGAAATDYVYTPLGASAF